MPHVTINTPELDEQIAITERRLRQLRQERRRQQQQHARATEQLDRRFRFGADGSDTVMLTLERLIDDLDAQPQPSGGDCDAPDHCDEDCSCHPGDRWHGLE